MTIYHQVEARPDTSVPDVRQDPYSLATFGFWIYLMTDCLLFTTLFATYAVLHTHTFGGPSAKELFHLGKVFLDTMILLFSSVTSGFCILAAVKSNKKSTLFWLGCTFLLGLIFIFLEITEFAHLVHEGYSWKRSAFLSSFFTLVGTHGLHVSSGLLWLLVLAAQIIFQGITASTFRRLVLFSLFWHFLDLVWIFIFTFVYLMGAL